MKKMIYPGIFHKEDSSYWVEFPDLEGCQSFGDTLEDVYANAKEALAAYCVTLLEQGQKLKQPTPIYELQTPDGAFASLIEADIVKQSQAVKKTLTIPSWLNAMAEAHHVNFSGVLQDALMQKLQIEQQ